MLLYIIVYLIIGLTLPAKSLLGYVNSWVLFPFRAEASRLVKQHLKLFLDVISPHMCRGITFQLSNAIMNLLLPSAFILFFTALQNWIRRHHWPVGFQIQLAIWQYACKAAKYSWPRRKLTSAVLLTCEVKQKYLCVIACLSGFK